MSQLSNGDMRRLLRRRSRRTVRGGGRCIALDLLTKTFASMTLRAMAGTDEEGTFMPPWSEQLWRSLSCRLRGAAP
jgi:hypothetical protein